MMSILSAPPAPVLDPVIKAEIDALSHLEMARLWRFTPPGEGYMTGAAGEYFAERFEKLGGMTYDVSVTIGYKSFGQGQKKVG